MKETLIKTILLTLQNNLIKIIPANSKPFFIRIKDEVVHVAGETAPYVDDGRSSLNDLIYRNAEINLPNGDTIDLRGAEYFIKKEGETESIEYGLFERTYFFIYKERYWRKM